MGVGDYFKVSSDNKFIKPDSWTGVVGTQTLIATVFLGVGAWLVYSHRTPDETFSSSQLLSKGAKKALVPFTLTEVALATLRGPTNSKLSQEIKDLKESEAEAKRLLNEAQNAPKPEPSSEELQRVQQELATANTLAKDLASESAQLRKDLAAANTQAKQLNQKLAATMKVQAAADQSKTSKLSQISSALNAANKKITALELKLKKNTDANKKIEANLRKDLAAANTQAKQLNQKLAATMKEQAAADQSKTSKLSQISSALNAREEKITTLESELRESKAANKQMEAELQNVMTALEDAQKKSEVPELAEELQKQLADAKQSIKAAELEQKAQLLEQALRLHGQIQAITTIVQEPKTVAGDVIAALNIASTGPDRLGT